MIYVVGIPGSVSAPVKIGSSENIAKRLLSLQRGEAMPLRVCGMISDPMALDVLASYPGGQPEERQLHLAFRGRRIEGEWFYLGRSATAVERIDAAIQSGGVDPFGQVAVSPLAPEPEPMTRLAESAAIDHERFRAWVEAGFTEDQALRLLAATFTATLG